MRSEQLGRRVLRFVFFAMPLSSVPFGFGPATSFFTHWLRMAPWQSDVVYVAASIGSIFVFAEILSKVEQRLFAPRAAAEVSAR